LENHSASLLEDSSQLILSNNKCLLIFMLKYFMKDTAKVTGDSRQLSLEKFIGRKAEKVTLVGKDESKFRGTIDKSISFDFVTIPDLEEKKYIGYISFVEH